MKPLPDPDFTLSWAARQRLRVAITLAGWLAVGALLWVLATLAAAMLTARPAQAATAVDLAPANAPPHAQQPGSAEALTLLQWSLAAVALGNLLLSISTWNAARHKVATARLDALEDDIRERQLEFEVALARLTIQVDTAPTHDHLATVYGAVNAVGSKVDQMIGAQDQTRALLQQLLQQQLRH